MIVGESGGVYMLTIEADNDATGEALHLERKVRRTSLLLSHQSSEY